MSFVGLDKEPVDYDHNQPNAQSADPVASYQLLYLSPFLSIRPCRAGQRAGQLRL